MALTGVLFNSGLMPCPLIMGGERLDRARRLQLEGLVATALCRRIPRLEIV